MLKILEHITLMRKIKQCKIALLWIKVIFFYFPAFVKLGIGSESGSASKWKIGSGFGFGSDPQHWFARYLAACMKIEYLTLLAILKCLSETGKTENPCINLILSGKIKKDFQRLNKMWKLRHSPSVYWKENHETVLEQRCRFGFSGSWSGQTYCWIRFGNDKKF